MDLRTLQARWRLEMIAPEEMPDFATRLLELGADSPALVELAGLLRPTFWEVSPVVERLFEEAQMSPISREEALWRIAYSAAREILDGTVTPRSGAGVLWKICSALGMPESLRYFVYLAAEYGEGPRSPEIEAAWFDARIRERAQELINEMSADGQSPPRLAT